MKKSFLTILTLLANVTFGEALPRSWYVLPEDAPNASRASESEERDQLTNAAIAVERVLKANSKALDDLSAREDRSARGADIDDWKFSALILDLGVSASGALGVLMAKGEVSAALYWRRLADAQEISVDGDRGSDLSFDGTETRRGLENKLEPIVRAVMATQEVKNEPALRQNLLHLVESYQSLVQQIYFDPGRDWYVSKLRLDISVDISGKVQPTITVGGGVRIRLEWEPSPTLGAARHAKPRGNNLDKLVATLAQEMRAVNYQSLNATGFKMKSLRFGLGLYGEGKFGVVKAGASVMGHLYLARKAVSHPVETPAPETLATIPLIADLNRQHLAFASDVGIRSQLFRNRAGETGAVYHIPKDTFKNGMEKAVRMGTYLADRANRSNGKKWELYQLKAEFALSLAGTVGIITVGGTGAVEMVFEKMTKTSRGYL